MNTPLTIHGIPVEATYAEAFPMYVTRVIVTGFNARWVQHATAAFCGFATSVIACVVEAGVDQLLTEDETPDGRCGASVLMFGVKRDDLAKQLMRRVGQCILTCPSTAVFSGMDSPERLPLGAAVRQFGDGFQISKRIGGRRFWRVPVMDGEFLCEHDTGIQKGVGGGNFILMAKDLAAVIHAVEAAVAAIEQIPDVITPFPGGVARSGSKVGSKYKALIASTNNAFCPTLRAQSISQLPEGVGAALEVVIDGLTEAAVGQAIRLGIEAACRAGSGHGLIGVTGGNYGGKLGKYHFHLKELFQ
jgi:formylmethanofuran--tetrahydromethanopterin N-formyltransferase